MKRADVVSIRSLFSGSSRFRCGPARPGYHWGPPQVAQLLVDLETAAQDSLDEEDVSEERLYLGPITIAPQKGGLATLLDGQQRLVTIAMFIAFARDRIASNSDRNRLDRMLVRRAFARPPRTPPASRAGRSCVVRTFHPAARRHAPATARRAPWLTEAIAARRTLHGARLHELLG